jgi:hypothetical protein
MRRGDNARQGRSSPVELNAQRAFGSRAEGAFKSQSDGPPDGRPGARGRLERRHTLNPHRDRRGRLVRSVVVPTAAAHVFGAVGESPQAVGDATVGAVLSSGLCGHELLEEPAGVAPHKTGSVCAAGGPKLAAGSGRLTKAASLTSGASSRARRQSGSAAKGARRVTAATARSTAERGSAG